MGSRQQKPHAICIPAPLQGHIIPAIKFAKILHSKGFLITFVNTEFNHQRLLRARGSDTLNDIPSFRFETIPDGLPPPENLDASQHIPSLARSTEETCLVPFKALVAKLNASPSPVTCIVSDFLMPFTLDAAKEFNIPEILFWTSGPGSFLCYEQHPNLLEKGLMPLKDSSFLTNGYLDTVVDYIPTCGIRLKDSPPPFIRILYPGDEYMVQFFYSAIERSKLASAVIFNTFHELECDIWDTISSKLPPFYAIGPLNKLEKKIVDESLAYIKSNLWKEDSECIKWLDSKAPQSVIYVNFGSITVMTPQQLVEFSWGLGKSNYSFLWIIRPDLVVGDSAVLPPEFLVETKDRGLLANWCDQEEALEHPSIGGFLTHSGWNSTIESISNGVPMICWPFFSDQQANCWWSCNKWEVAMEINNDVKSEDIKNLVIEMMNGTKGDVMRKNVVRWKSKTEEACSFLSGSSIVSLEKIIHLLKTSSQ